MSRRVALLATLLLLVAPQRSSAQFGWGWGGWGGFSSTLQGDIARGLGVFAYGAGIYNLDSAAANSINTDTWIRWNEYVAYSQQQASRAYLENKYKNIHHNKSKYHEIVTRIRENPTARDVEDGDALNAALDQLSDPRIHSSALRAASAPVDAALIQKIPFRNNTRAVAFILADLKESTNWPSALDSERFALDKQEFESVVDQVRREEETGEISEQTLKRARALVADLRYKLESDPLPDTVDNLRALKFVKSLAGLVRLLGVDEAREVMRELGKMKNVTIGHLVGFMQAFNLRFGPAMTAQQRIIYRDLYTELDRARDKILAEARLEEAGPRPSSESASEFFATMNLEQLQGKKKLARSQAAPPPANPQR